MTVARPMPLAPPVTIATLPTSRFMPILPSDAMVVLRGAVGKPDVSPSHVYASAAHASPINRPAAWICTVGTAKVIRT